MGKSSPKTYCLISNYTRNSSSLISIKISRPSKVEIDRKFSIDYMIPFS
nr:MAG TPA: hypothetical protein [Caudoviricetes sp.]